MEKQVIINNLEQRLMLMSEMDKAQEKHEKIVNQYNNPLYEIPQRKKTSWGVWLVMFFISFFIVAFIYAIFMVLSYPRNPIPRTLRSNEEIFTLIIWVLVIIISIVMNYLRKKWLINKINSQNKKIKEQNAICAKELYPDEEKIVERINNIKRKYSQLNSQLSFLGYDYPDAVSYFRAVLIQGRADTIKEAINLYEDYLHRQRVEANQKQMIDGQREMLVVQRKMLNEQREIKKQQMLGNFINATGHSVNAAINFSKNKR